MFVPGTRDRAVRILLTRFVFIASVGVTLPLPSSDTLKVISLPASVLLLVIDRGAAHFEAVAALPVMPMAHDVPDAPPPVFVGASSAISART